MSGCGLSCSAGGGGAGRGPDNTGRSLPEREEARTDVGSLHQRPRNGLKPCPFSGALKGCHSGPSGAGSGFSYCSAAGRGPPARGVPSWGRSPANGSAESGWRTRPLPLCCRAGPSWRGSSASSSSPALPLCLSLPPFLLPLSSFSLCPSLTPPHPLSASAPPSSPLCLSPPSLSLCPLLLPLSPPLSLLPSSVAKHFWELHVSDAVALFTGTGSWGRSRWPPPPLWALGLRGFWPGFLGPGARGTAALCQGSRVARTSPSTSRQTKAGKLGQESLRLRRDGSPKVKAGGEASQILLEDLAHSDPKLALTGVPIVQWPKRDKLKFPTRPKVRVPTIPITKPHTMKPAPRLTPVRPAASPIVSGARRRRVRCRKCKACVQGECGVCHYCRDMKKFGGPGRMKQSCVLRQCLAPRLPHSVTCSLCGEVDQNEETQDFEKKLMECCICNEIVHPGCLQMDGEGLLNDELPNCWECPKCYQEDTSEKKRKMDDSDEDVVQAKVLRPLRSCDEPLTPPPHSPTAMLQLIHDPVSPRGVVTRSSPGAGPSDHHSASRDERFKRRQLLRLQATERTMMREKENNPSGKKELSEVEKAKIRGSYLTVTLQRPTKELHGTSIVPKLQAITASSTNLRHSPRVLVQHCPARTPQRGEEEGLAGEEEEDEEDEDEEDSAEEGGAARLNGRGGWAQDGEESWMQREVWMSVFRYLSRRELCECMRVCKTWYKWCCDKRLWTKIDLSRCKAIVPQALSGIIKRQPVSLDLSWTNISKKQLTWLVNRLPGLKDLLLAGCSWSAVSALSTSSCPLLRTLDLRWAVGIKDPQIRDLLTPPTDKPGQDNRSKLRNMTDFRLAGLDITDATLRLIIRHMPLLSRLDLSHCSHLTDQSSNLLTAVGSSTRNSLTEINMAGCNKLTDQSLLYLRRISNVTLIDLRGCKQITRKACEHFISDLSINSLYCLSDEKLIQKIS